MTATERLGGRVAATELGTAIGRLDDPTDRQRAVLGTLASRLVTRLLEPPVGEAIAAAGRNEHDTVEALSRLFEE